MPQLNPNPWFIIIFFTWILFLLLTPYKILTHNFPLPPLFKDMKKISSSPWNWLWQ